MKKIEAHFLQSISQGSNIAEIAALLSGCTVHEIDIASWPGYAYKPVAGFVIAHNNRSVLLKFNVGEQFLRAAWMQPNDPVYTDSCVEFFVSFDGRAGYYNFEFNCLGTCLSAFGTDRNNRTFLTGETIDKIKYQALVIKNNERTPAASNWELTIAIPLEVFCYHELRSLNNLVCRANFYKCGDDLPEPHYLSWAPIDSPAPDFHLPQYFGEVRFL